MSTERLDYFELHNNKVWLRDMCEADIDDYIIWNTTEIEWQNWDSPWEKEEKVDVYKLRESLKLRLHSKIPRSRRRLEICKSDGNHIGWVSSYYINGDISKLAVGIDIPNQSYRGEKLGQAALSLFIAYKFETEDVDNIYTETWSGNYRMIKLAEKLGFQLAKREFNSINLDGQVYHGLTFKLDKIKFINTF
ncbi:GNAT family N-acetyltransferase [Clostridium sp. C8-1-8]|uniref:GNAT family N-acetyltransferase n=1 Tax=Clostridium sp. C8-1-8 TaxID=2698831 RepID=UPI00136BBD28|nr:GNAT family N-acetyltransferase [Clostridium sp. C8-1-8]